MGDLHRPKNISSEIDEEIPLKKEKFRKAKYPLRFINSIINQFITFNNSNNDEDGSFIIPPNLSDEESPILVELP